MSLSGGGRGGGGVGRGGGCSGEYIYGEKKEESVSSPPSQTPINPITITSTTFKEDLWHVMDGGVLTAKTATADGPSPPPSTAAAAAAAAGCSWVEEERARALVELEKRLAQTAVSGGDNVK